MEPTPPAPPVLALALGPDGRLEVSFPGIAAPMREGQALRTRAQEALAALGFTPGPTLARRPLQLLVALTLGRLRGEEAMDVSTLGLGAWPGLSARARTNALDLYLAPPASPRRGEPGWTPWGPPSDRSLIQICQLDGPRRRSRGPFRVNPRYRVDAVVHELKAWQLSEEAAERLHTLGGWEALAQRSNELAALGREHEAWDLVGDWLHTHPQVAPPPGAALAWAALGMQIGATADAEGAALGVTGARRAAASTAELAEAWHIAALTRRQRGDLAGSEAAARRALALLERAQGPPALLRDRGWQYRLTLTITQSGLSLARAHVEHILPMGVTPPGWHAARAGFQALRRQAEERGRARDVAHATLRLMAHEHTRWELGDEARATAEEAERLAGELSVAAQVILRRVRHTDRLLRGFDREALEALRRLQEEDASRGYRHQVETIRRSIAAARARFRERR